MTMPNAPEPAPAAPGILAAKFTLDARTIATIGLGLLGLGLVLGFKIRGSVPDVVQIPAKPAPCADCAEKAIQEARLAPEVDHMVADDPSPIPGA
jgi:hypothetical protein